MSSMPSSALVDAAIAIEPLVVEVESRARSRGDGCGAVAVFAGVVRHTHLGRRVRRLEYEAFEPLALRALARIEAEIDIDWPGAVIVMRHRLGRLAIGEISVAVVAASAHRAGAFQIARYAIERIKQIAPIWKHEFFEDGDAWVEGALVDVDDESARRLALERACA